MDNLVSQVELLAAAKEGNLVSVRALLSDPSCDLLARDEEGNTALHIAASRGHHDVVLELASRYTSPSDEATAGGNNEGQTPLHLACYKGWIRCVDPLAIKFPNEINISDNYKNTPIMAASLAGHEGIMSLLKERYKVNTGSKGGKSLTHKGEENVLKPKKVDLTEQTTCLLAAGKQGNLVSVRALLSDPSCDLLARDEEGNTALHIAASRGHHNVVLELASRYTSPSDEATAGVNNKGQTPLHLACCKGWVECVRTLATRFPGDLKVKNERDNLPLHDAALFGHEGIVDCLCEEFGGDVDSLGFYNRTCLLFACSGGHVELTRNLLNRHECRRDALDEVGGLASTCAAFYGHTHLLQILIDEFNFTPTSVALVHGLNLFHEACAGKHYETAKILINKYNLDPVAKDVTGLTALHHVCGILGNDGLENVGNFHTPPDVVVTAFIDYLVSLKCDPMDRDKEGHTALHHAAGTGQRDVVIQLVKEYKCDPMDRNKKGQNSLHFAAYRGQREVVIQLIREYKCPVECRDNSKYTPLHYAAQGGHAHVIHILLSEFGADVEARNNYNGKALDVAALAGHSNVVSLLVDQFGCSLHTKGRSPLHNACDGGHLELVEKLIDDYHCDPIARDDEGLTPLHVAALAGKEHVVKRLVGSYNCSVECRANNQNTPLHFAARRGHAHVVQVLLSELGADVDACNKQNNTALNVAALEGHSNVVTLLVEQFEGFHQACRRGDTSLMQRLVDDYHCDPLTRNNRGATPLHIAALKGKERLVKWFVTDNGCDVQCTDNNGDTALHNCAKYGHIPVVRLLLSKPEADVGARNKQSNTPLHLAALNGHSNVVTLLVDQFGCSPHTKGYNNRPLLHQACEGGHMELVETLIDDYHCDPMDKDDEGLTPLHIAALAGKEHVARRLVREYDCSVECRDNNEDIPLHCAAIKGHAHVIQALLSELGAHVEACNKQSNAALNVAALNGHSNVVALLVGQFGCSPHTKGYNNRSLLHQACEGGHLELVEKLIDDYHCDLMARDDEGLTPLHVAALEGNDHVVWWLVSNCDYSVECRDNDDNTPLLIAAVKGQVHVLQVLLSEFGAYIEACNNQNNTALNVAALNGHSNVVTLLVDQFGCSPHTKGYNNRTPLHQACEGGHLELVEKLIDDYHCDPMARDDEGLSPLHIAAMNGNNDVITLLVDQKEKCVPLNEADKDNNTPLHLASLNGHTDVAIQLLKLGSDLSRKGENGQTPLLMTCQRGHSSLAMMFLKEKGVSCNAVDQDGESALHYAASSPLDSVVEVLVNEFKCSVDVKNSSGQTPLHKAVLNDHTRTVQLLVSKCKANTEVCSDDGHTPLGLAVSKNNINLTRILIEDYDCSPNAVLWHGKTILQQAFENRQWEVVHHLLNSARVDCSVRDGMGQTVLHISSAHGKNELVRKIMNIPTAAGSINSVDKNGDTPLHLAAREGHACIVNVLKSVEGVRMLPNSASLTPLLVTVANGRIDVLKEFSQEISEDKSKNENGLMILACKNDRRGVLHHLITDHGYNPQCADSDGNSLLHHAALYNKPVVMEFLFTEYNCSLAALNMKRETPLHVAIKNGNVEAERKCMDLYAPHLTARARQAEARAAQLEEQCQQFQDDNIRLREECQQYRQRLLELELAQQTRTEQADAGAAFQQPSWVITKEEVTMTEEVIGRGGWGSIRIALFRQQRVAAKTLHQQIISAHNLQLFSREMYLSSTLRHPNIVLFIGATIEGEPIILTELMQTSLRKLFEQNSPPQPLPQNVTLSILQDVGKGLNYLHLMRPDALIHRDISSANILLESSTRSVWRAKLSDFGSTNFLSRSITVGPGNPVYAAPEAYNPHQHSPKMDVFSFGILIIEMCTGCMPSDKPREREQTVKQIKWGEAVSLIKQCINTDRDKRPSMKDILKTLDPTTRSRKSCSIS